MVFPGDATLLYKGTLPGVSKDQTHVGFTASTKKTTKKVAISG